MNDEELSSLIEERPSILSLSFLEYIIKIEKTVSEEEQQLLDRLGSKLMALKEGIKSIDSDKSPYRSQPTEKNKRTDTATGLSHSSVIENFTNRTNFMASLKNETGLNLSREGMELLQHQAEALDATLGAHRARVLTEIIGRVAISNSKQIDFIDSSDAAGRILSVLVNIPDREERRKLLPDAFTQPGDEIPHVDEEKQADAMSEEQLFTTPLQLLQAIDLWINRLQFDANENGAVKHNCTLLIESPLELNQQQLLEALSELREDVLAEWDPHKQTY